ncbi:MAG: Fic family protein [Limnohabitans sp.]|nr:MAG: Fic family protein [Limnohabitans sp.]
MSDFNDQLLTSIQAQPDGFSLAEASAKWPNVPRRSLQRALAKLVVEGKIAPIGKARATRYLAKLKIAPKVAEYALPTQDGLSESSMWRAEEELSTGQWPLSPDSKDIRAYLAQPWGMRQAVGYQSEFLQAYLPNVTFYLPQPVRAQLHRMGRTGPGPQPAGTYGRAVLDRLLIDLSWASSHLEGNTYTRLDTRALIAHGQQAQGHGVTETQMILNHKAAIELLMEHVEAPQFSRYLLMNLHSALSENLLESPEDEGRLRLHPVQIGQSVYQPPSGQSLIGSLLDEVLVKFNAIEDPFEQAFFAMVHLPYLQPFADCNKRCSRLLANWPLLRANLCPLTFLGVSQAWYTDSVLGVYEMTRVELLRDLFMWAYERSTKEYLSAKSRVVEPDLLRLTWRDAIRQTVKAVVQNPEQDPLALVAEQVALAVPGPQREDVRALVMQELRRLHEGVLVRYGLRPVELERWRSIQG